MAYTKNYSGGWQSGETGGTPITPETLNHIEDGIATNDTTISTLNGNIRLYPFSRGILLNGNDGTGAVGYGLCVCTFIKDFVRIDFEILITTAGTGTNRFDFGINRDFVKTLTGYTGNITPLTGGMMTYYNSDWTVNTNLTAYGGTLEAHDQFWTPGRLYTTDMDYGAWASSSMTTGLHLVGTCFGSTS